MYTRRIDWILKVVLILLFGVSWAPQAFSAEIPRDKLVEELGRTDGNSVNSGFVFFDGRYIDPPYIVSRQGLEVFINDVTVKKWSQWPLPDYSIKEDPGLPEGLTEKNSMDDIRRGHAARKFRYLHQHFPEDVAMKKMAEYYRQLPFVESVAPERLGDFGDLVVKMKNGDVELIDVRRLPPDSVSAGWLTAQDVLNTLERCRRRFENRLKKGDCFFFFSNGGELSFGKMKVSKDLRLIVAILRSKRSHDEKVALLERLSVLPPKTVAFHSLVTNFRASGQIEKQIDAIVKISGITPRTFDEIPLIPPVMEKKLSLIRYFKDKIKNALQEEKDPKVREKLQEQLRSLEKEENEMERRVDFYKKVK